MRQFITRSHLTCWAMGLSLAACVSTGLTDTQQISERDFAALTVIETQDLKVLRGGDGGSNLSVENHQDMQATVNGAIFNADNINNGAVAIGPHALDNFSGVGMFNFVTGNGNAVNAAMGVTVFLQ